MKKIIEIAIANGSLKHLVTAVKAAGLGGNAFEAWAIHGLCAERRGLCQAAQGRCRGVAQRHSQAEASVGLPRGAGQALAADVMNLLRRRPCMGRT